jgi:hypothetical protein
MSSSIEARQVKAHYESLIYTTRAAGCIQLDLRELIGSNISRRVQIMSLFYADSKGF